MWPAFLQAVSEGLVPGIPSAVRVLLLGQIQSDKSTGRNDTVVHDETVFQHVMRSDKRREQLLYESRRLSEAVENIKDPTAATRVYRELSYQRLEHAITKAREKAAGVSGARGSKARNTLTQLEEELSQAFDR